MEATGSRSEECGYEYCSRAAESNGLCIFHIPKPTSEEKQQMSPYERRNAEQIDETFRARFSTLLEHLERNSRFEEEHGAVQKPPVEEYKFVGFSFPSINLKNTKYSKPVYFIAATFSGEANFSSAKFRGEANFYGATFIGKADFYRATFIGKAGFLNATFIGKADFYGAIFIGKANFSNATFSGQAAFLSATFGGETYFSTDPNTPSFEHECHFQWLIVRKDAHVEFMNVNLSKATFLDTDLELISFKDVKWPPVKKRLFGRDVALWDELREGAISKSSYEQIAENYRQLVLNYDRKRDYAMAEQFHVGEMEVLRKKAGAEAKWPWVGWLRRWLNGYAIYRPLSHYGTSYWHAGLMLVVLLVCFSWIFLFTGFQPASEESPVAKMTEENPKPEVIEYDWGGSTPVSQWIADYWKSVLLTLSIMTFQRERSYKPEGDLSEAWFVIATLVLAAQVALVLLAIRRRFKR